MTDEEGSKEATHWDWGALIAQVKSTNNIKTTVDDCSILCVLMSFVGWTEMLRLPALLSRSSKMTKAEAQHGTRMYKALPSAG